MSNFRVIKVAILFALIFSFLSGGCSKDENPTEAKNDLALVGYWELTKMSSEYQGVADTLTESQIDSMGLVWTLKIEDDGTIEQTTNMSGPLVTMSGTWSTSANQLTTILTGPTGGTGTVVYEYAIDENILKLNWEIPAGTKFYAEFIKQ
ncbi:MAG: lipocalin family protein [Calditrichia bacterium]|jgi:hypothetical protein|nr:lipocalin family protein [Calditrichia bacterium]